MVTTIVTTNMTGPITGAYGVKRIEVLTGFKFIGEQIKLFEQTGSNHYVFGLEESYGCLAGTHARDKDAIVAVMCLCEVAAYCKKHGKTLWDMMLETYEKYGYYKESQYTITLKGIDGSRQIAEIMEKLRRNPPKAFGGHQVLKFRDYQTDRIVDMATGEEGKDRPAEIQCTVFRTPRRCVVLRPSLGHGAQDQVLHGRQGNKPRGCTEEGRRSDE